LENNLTRYYIFYKMKKILFLFVLLLLSRASFSQVPKPGKPAFIVNYKESGKNANESWSYSGVVKFSLSNWNEPLRGKGYTPEARKLPLDLDPGAILRLEPGQKLTFYPSEVDESGSGSHGSYTRFLGTDGVETLTETTDQGTRTVVIDDAGYRKEHGVPTNENFLQNARYYQLDELAELERTETGAILHAYTAIGDNISEWAVSDEAFDQVWPQVTEFVLTDKDIQSWQQISRINTRSGSYDEDNITITISVKMEVPDLKKPEVTLEGCSEMGIGESGQLTASGEPGGGSYRFWTEPSDALTIQADGASATLKGASPGRATIFVEYTSPEGVTVQKTKNGACVKVDSYNGGEAIPQIAFYDVTGKRLPGIKNIPVAIQPQDGADLLKYVPVDPGVISATGIGEEVVVQGIRQGKTSFQATTPCGATTGPVVEVEVVNCDDETIANLAQEARVAGEALKQQLKEMERILSSEDYKEAVGGIVESAAQLAVKTSGLIIGMAGGVPGADQSVKAASEIFGRGSALLDMLRSGTTGEAAVNAAKMAIELFGNSVMQVATGASETYDAAKTFGKNLGVLEGSSEELANVSKWTEHWKRYIDDLVRRQQLCSRSTEQPQGQEEPVTQPTPNPVEPSPADEPVPAAGTPPVKEQPAGENPTEEPTADEPPTGEPPVSPPPPTSEISQVGLPYTPAECGCSTSKAIGLSQEGFSSLQAGMKNLGTCVDNFSSGPLTDYVKTIEEWQSVTDSLATFVKSGAAGLQLAAKETIPHIESLLQRTQSFDEDGKAFIGEFNKCSESMNSVMEVLRNAETVTVDSIKTKY
jgi:hypothetical protein